MWSHIHRSLPKGPYDQIYHARSHPSSKKETSNRNSPTIAQGALIWGSGRMCTRLAKFIWVLRCPFHRGFGAAQTHLETSRARGIWVSKYAKVKVVSILYKPPPKSGYQQRRFGQGEPGQLLAPHQPGRPRGRHPRHGRHCGAGSSANCPFAIFRTRLQVGQNQWDPILG